mmetsp:Transcript_7161/g.9059  ORF Transcript_7161/g.9059 Transcript_7161/m.9059 type:complete len:86 (+) Transcript_7161:598-855(+)
MYALMIKYLVMMYTAGTLLPLMFIAMIVVNAFVFWYSHVSLLNTAKMAETASLQSKNLTETPTENLQSNDGYPNSKTKVDLSTQI